MKQFGIIPKIGLASSLLSVNMITKLKTDEKLQVAQKLIKVLYNDNENDNVLLTRRSLRMGNNIIL